MRRLRRKEELHDAHSHILAITFTNKATNEMKERIVGKLHELAIHEPGSRTDYMAEFCEEFKCGPEQISDICREALATLLSDYSDFQVSTIDSFFQTILRTFAYETDLNDSYQVELDSSYISQVGIDMTMASIDDRLPDREVKRWIGLIMQEWRKEGKAWNILQKSESKGSAYLALSETARMMASEEYKKRRDALDKYFTAHPDFFSIFRRYDTFYSEYPRSAFMHWKSIVEDFGKELDKLGDTASNVVLSNVLGQLSKCNACTSWKELPSFSYNSVIKSQSVLKKAHKLPAAEANAINKKGLAMYFGLEEFLKSEQWQVYNLWLRYRPKLLFLGLLKSIRENSLRYLEENNTVELAETNVLLRKVIGDNETPFIYERLGTRVDHYLIDEFQDTSRMQWLNISPLLHETESRGAENLVIGDAKQSIYRFRNAAVELITTDVPREFPHHTNAGELPEENTNWRSKHNVVLFNNTLFRHLASYIDQNILTPELSVASELYRNTVQPTAGNQEGGYVKVSFPASGADHIREMGPLVHEMLGRGYRQSDIAFLVATRDQGKELIQAFIDYNQTLSAALPPVEFISEDSLLLKESKGVQTVVSALEVIRSGAAMRLRNQSGNDDKGPGRAADLGYNFSFYCSTHPELSFEEQIQRFLENPDPATPLAEMLGEMKTITLPSVVEGIIARFVPESLRHTDAPFLAALQDCVLDYCENYTADVASFLRWWDAKKQTLSISSPEDADAVRIMTVHKSKGLEFKCVVIPFATTDLTLWNNRHPDIIWVRPALPAPEGCDPLPCEIPIDATDSLIGSPHEQEARKAATAALIDRLNTVYVAFTRAVNELYVYMPASSRTSATALPFIFKSLQDALNSSHGDAGNFLLPDGAIVISEKENSEIVWEFGIPMSNVRTQDETKVKNENEKKEYLVGCYNVNLQGADIKYREAKPMVTDDEEEDTDPRSEGNLLHMAMADIRTADDVDRAVRKLWVQGLISSEMSKEFSSLLRNAISRHPEWFHPGLTVLNERTLFIYRRQRRADRIVITPDGDAIVIDFKFGNHRNDAKYSGQVRRYMNSIRATGKYRSVSGYVWYVPTDDMLEVAADCPKPTQPSLFD